MAFKALLVSKTEEGQSVAFSDLTDDDLMDGDVTIRVTHSTINYKDGLAITGKAPVVRRWPMIPGVDFAGEVIESRHADWKPGDTAVLNGFGVGEVHYGGYSERARVNGDWLVPLAAGLTTAQAMAVGTAGITSALSLIALERFGIAPDRGPVIVTGAAGGVGSVAIALLASKGYTVIASTGRVEEEAYLKSLGAESVIHRDELSGKAKPLAKESWAAGIDAVGSHTLANVISRTRYGGVIAACGLAQGLDLPTTVAPFILRGVTLTGIDSVMAPRDARIDAWSLIADHLDRAALDAMSHTISLDAVPETAPTILGGGIRGRTIVEI